MDDIITALEEAAWRALERDAGAKESVLVIIRHVMTTHSLSAEQQRRLRQLADEVASKN